MRLAADSNEQLLREMYKAVNGHYPAIPSECVQPQSGLPTPALPEVPTDARYFIDADSLELPPDVLSLQVDDSCKEWESSPKNTLKTRLLTGFSRLLNQVSRCANAYKLPNLNDAQFILNHLRISCYKKADSNWLAKANPERSKPGKEYEIMINTQSTGIALSDYFAEIGWSDNVLSSTIFHESLHLSANNNKTWHERGEAMQQQDQDFFSDRVYLTEALCFPDAQMGRRLRKFAGEDFQKFHASCLAAWMQVDPDVSSPKAVPFKKREAVAICRRAEEGVSVLSGNNEKKRLVPDTSSFQEQLYFKLLNPTPR